MYGDISFSALFSGFGRIMVDNCNSVDIEHRAGLIELVKPILCNSQSSFEPLYLVVEIEKLSKLFLGILSHIQA